MGLPADPAQVFAGVAASAPGQRAEAIVRAVLRLWDSPAQRNLMASQLVGLVLVRYVVRLEPLASASQDDVGRLVAPDIQRYLTGRL